MNFRLPLELIVGRLKSEYGSIKTEAQLSVYFVNFTKYINFCNGSCRKANQMLLQVTLRDLEINPRRFRKYAVKSARKFVKLMPTLVYQLFVHISALLPIRKIPRMLKKLLIKRICKDCYKSVPKSKLKPYLTWKICPIDQPFCF